MATLTPDVLGGCPPAGFRSRVRKSLGELFDAMLTGRDVTFLLTDLVLKGEQLQRHPNPDAADAGQYLVLYAHSVAMFSASVTRDRDAKAEMLVSFTPRIQEQLDLVLTELNRALLAWKRSETPEVTRCD